MKTNKVELYKWFAWPQTDSNIEIDWPKVHKTIGLDHTNWLLKQPEDQCQIILERNDMYCRLIAEFYNEQTLTHYHLMWAK
jgi:hypothetical protein